VVARDPGASPADACGEPRPLLSVIIPTLDEAVALPSLLGDLAAIDAPCETIVADGGSTDDTVGISRRAGARVIVAPPGRGTQLRAGAEHARAEVLCFLHADVRLGDGAAARLADLARGPRPQAFAFRLRLDAAGARYRAIEAGANLRSRLAGLPYGDQGLVVRREDYLRAGGYPPIPLMEDVALVRALRAITEVRLLDAELRVSARRWQREGPLRRMVRNWVLLGRYLTGTPAEQLARSYRPESPDSA
jgi:rSAM/selenodomain-associated transferase 2